jgi:hypothetical protein
MSQVPSAFPFPEKTIKRIFINGESSTAFAAGDVGFIDNVVALGDAGVGKVKLATATKLTGIGVMALEAVAAGASGLFLVEGYTTANAGISAIGSIADGSILTPTATPGTLGIVAADDVTRIAKVLDASEDEIYFNGFGI